MPQLFLYAVAVTAAIVSCLFLVVLLRSVFAGSGRITEYRRRRYGLKAWWQGAVPRTHPGTTAHEFEGIKILAHGNKIVDAKRTRAPAKD